MKTDFHALLNTDSSRLTADIVTEAVENDPLGFEEIVGISLKAKPPVNWRAARVVALAADENRDLFVPYVNEIALRFPEFMCDGLKRSYAWLLAKYTRHLDNISQSVLIDVCFKYMVENEKPAVKYNCMKLLYEMSNLLPELKGELAALIDYNVTLGIFKMNGEVKKIYRTLELQIK